jgi:ATP-dependent helicase/nuclease subunit B
LRHSRCITLFKLTELPQITLTDALEQRLPALVPGARVRRRILQIQSDEQARRGEVAWLRAPVETIDSWLRGQFEQLVDAGKERRVLLNSSQAMLLWEQAVDDSSSEAALLRPRETARSAMSAARLAVDWQISTATLENSLAGPETAAFLAWRAQVVALLQDSNWITADHLAPRVRDAIASGELSAPKVLALVIPTRPTPALAGLVRALADAGTKVLRIEARPSQSTSRLLCADTPEHEISLMARWCSHQIDADANVRLAVTGQQLDDHNNTIAHELECALHGGDLWASLGAERRYHVAGNLALAQFPAINTALLALRLATGAIELDNASVLIRSAFLDGAQGELGERAQLEVRLRKLGRRLIEPKHLVRVLNEDREGTLGCPKFRRLLGAVGEFSGSTHERLAPDDWAPRFGALLRKLGWPGNEPGPDNARAASRRFIELLPEFGQLGALAGQMNAGPAVGLLGRLAGEAQLDLPGSSSANVTVLSPDDVAVVPYDGVWLLGATDQRWPSPVRANPFLPAAVQSQLGMPGANAAQALADARRLATHLLSSAPTVVTSFAQRMGDSPLRVSPLFAAVPRCEQDALALADADDPWLANVGSGATERLEDFSGCKVAPDAPAPGGTSLIADQSDCPFRAYAVRRLGVNELEYPEDGIDPRTAGNLVHKALEHFWREVKTSSALKRLDEHEESIQIDQAVQAALDALEKTDPEMAQSRLAQLERERLTKVVRGWLNLERERGANFSVASLEKSDTVELGNIRLRVRADRIDRLDDGALVVVDYKTSRTVSVTGWDEERLQEPQVPLYATTSNETVAGAALGQVATGLWRFKGHVAERGILPVKMPKDIDARAAWTQRLEQWQISLLKLSDEVANGVATVTPRKPAVCRYCPVSEACRIAEHTTALSDEGLGDEAVDGAGVPGI